MRKILSLLLVLLMQIIVLVGCGKKNMNQARVYYLNFKPEQDAAWQQLAKAYTDETGVQVTVVTAAEGTYEATLTSEMDKSDAPTLFQVNGPVGLNNWYSYCYDLSGSDIVKELISENFTLKRDGQILGVAYVVETYGIIYNKQLLDKYFNSSFSTVKSIDQLNNFEALKTVATEIQANKEALGVDGAFASAGMDSSSDWRFKTHLANLPLYYEYRDMGVTQAAEISGKYLDNYKNIWDLYINNSTVSKTDLAAKTGTDAETEFKTGKAVFYQNGTWAYSGVKYDEKTKVGLKDADFGMLPIYIGVSGEENQGLCTGTENYWCVNKNASAESIEATLKFINWCVTSETGTKALSENMGFEIPFKNAKETTNPLIKIANNYVKNGKEPISWTFSTMPSDNWKNGVGTALTQYAAGKGSFEDLKKAFVDGWKTEYNATK